MKRDVTKEEWEEWREMHTTRAIIDRLREFRMNYLVGIVGTPKERRNETVDSIIGMDLIIEIIENVHREEP